MINLEISDFSCIRKAQFQIAPVTVLIGPQGSGKSVTTKLSYFFAETFNRMYQSAQKRQSLIDFKKETATLFKLWFPTSAWGADKFNITYSAGLFSARALRRTSKQVVTDDVAISFSEFFNDHYCGLLADYEELEAVGDADERGRLSQSLAAEQKIYERSFNSLSAALGSNYIGDQTFIPAGRAFFTSIGRLVAAIEQGSSLDPVTIRFAKLFASVRDRRNRSIRSSIRLSKEEIRSRNDVMNELFGGEIKFERELEYVKTNDGRIVPFSALSSGQQELLPMWMIIEYLSSFPFIDGDTTSSYYIEEPEAHLFPAAQSLLMDFLVRTIVGRTRRSNLILTTHSPYILSKLNNYIFAGQIAKNVSSQNKLSTIVQRDCWLEPNRVRAYGIVNGVFESLIGEDGLIDAKYIDSVSEDVAQTFSELLDISDLEVDDEHDDVE